MRPISLEGRLFFYSETGTEGGYWAFQDSNYISLVSPSFGVTNDRKVWDTNNQNRFGLSSNAEVRLNQEWLPIPDPIIGDADYLASSLYRGEEKGDLFADKRLMERYNFKIKYTAQRLNETYGANNWRLEGGLSNVILKDGTQLHFGSTPTTEPSRPYGIPQSGITRVTVKWDDGTIEYQRRSDTILVEQWDYKGLHVLKNGDRLRIIYPTEKSVAWDGVIELKQVNLFTEHANGLWIHADQIGISREVWANYFFNNFPAQLQKD